MRVLFYKETPTFVGNVMEINGLKVLITQELIRINPIMFSYKLVEYVKLTNIPPWSINNEFNGEVFELSTLNNLSKFGFAPTKEQFLEGLINWIIAGSFTVTNKIEYVAQERRKLIDEATKRGLMNKPKYLKYPWQEPSITRKPNWGGSDIYINENLSEFRYCGVCLYKDGQWAEIIKERCLVDYEQKLIDQCKNYGWLKVVEPKLYWTKVLQEIANELNNNKEIVGTRYFLNYNEFNDPCVLKHESVNYGLIYFSTAGNALKAAEIIGNNLEYLYQRINGRGSIKV